MRNCDTKSFCHFFFQVGVLTSRAKRDEEGSRVVRYVRDPGTDLSSDPALYLHSHPLAFSPPSSL